MPTLLIFEIISLALTAARVIVGNKESIYKSALWLQKKFKEKGVPFDVSKFKDIGP